MPSAKRERKRAGRQARQEYLQSQRRKKQTRRRAIVIGLAVLVVAGLAALFSGGDDDTTDVATEDGKASTTTSSTPGSTTAANATAAAATCPPADGSAPRTTKFQKPFEGCIDPAKSYTATMETDVGTIKIALDAKKAPKTVNNFVALARYHFYDGVPFHRVIPDFVVQGGDANNQNGTGDAGYKFEDELPEPDDYRAGSLAMANSGPDTNGSQFFIVTSDAGAKTLVQAVGGQAKYSLFGQVIEGMDVVKKIEADGDQSGTPKVVHKMVKVTIEES